jgi:hypothetical protein
LGWVGGGLVVGGVVAEAAVEHLSGGCNNNRMCTSGDLAAG